MSGGDRSQKMENHKSGVEIPPRSTKQETRPLHQTEAFNYLGCHFIPAGFSTDSRTPAGRRKIQMMEWAAEPFYGVNGSLYSKKSFLEIAESDADVYYCVEQGLYYMPGEHKLFEYTGKFQWLQEGRNPESSNKSMEEMETGEKNLQMLVQEQRKETTQVLSRKRWN